MNISTYQMQNVLRAYGKQLSLNRRLGRQRESALPSPTERITISTEARRKAVVEKIASDIIGRIASEGPQQAVEREVFRELETEFGNRLSIDGGDKEMVFKVVDTEKQEQVGKLSLEDTKYLKKRLEEITRSKVQKDML